MYLIFIAYYLKVCYLILKNNHGWYTKRDFCGKAENEDSKEYLKNWHHL